MAAPYARPFKASPAQFPEVGDTVWQNAYGMGLGRLEDVGRTGTIVAVNQTKVVVDFGAFQGRQSVHPNVLRLDGRAAEVTA